jgi:hypothetical protein
MTMYDEDRLVTLLRDVDLPQAPPGRLMEVTRRARRNDSRRASVLATVMAVVMLAGVVSALSLQDRSDVQELTVADAARATQDMGSARVTVRVVLTRSASAFLPVGELIAMTGPVDFRHQKLALKGTFSRAPIEMRALGQDRWIKSPESTLGSTGSKPWVHSVESASKGASDFANMDPSRLLEVLTAEGSVVSRTRDGDRTTTVLRLPPAAFRTAFGSAAASGSDVSVVTDGEGRIRETTAETTMRELGTQRMTVSYDDFGIDVDVQPPPADQVREGTDTGSTGSSQQLSGTVSSSSPEDLKRICEQIRAKAQQMPPARTDAERAQRKQVDQMLAQVCAKS